MAKQVRILVIDDEEVVISGIKRILSIDRIFNYNIDSAGSAVDGWSKASKNTYDIIISDILMPGMDGMTLLQKLVEAEITSKIIMITAYATMKTALVALRKGAFDFIAKPFTYDEICSSIHRALSVPPTRDEKIETMYQEKNNIRPERVYAIPGKSWAEIQEDYSVLIGVEKGFLERIGKISTINLVKKREQISQGRGFGIIISEDQLTHTLLAPLTGLIINVNRKIIKEINKMDTGSICKLWLIHIQPSDIDSEVSNLILK